MTDAPTIVPAPMMLSMGSGEFSLPPGSRVISVAEDGFGQAARLLAETLAIAWHEGGVAVPGDIRLTREGASTVLGPEGYLLQIDASGVVLRASDAAGAFWGTQTLRQLLPRAPAMTIRDRPRFPWRGMLLDCCRHFMSVEFVKRSIDLLALHKMNRFHWHLTEDQGWRLEIDRYPALTDVAAWRLGADGSRYGGFYTKDDVREVLAYAQARQVTVVPEIELPGHSVAALAALPELSCSGGPFAVETRWGIFEDVYCAGNEATFTFLENVFDEVLALFPGRWIHIGGDECPKVRWRACARCQARTRDLGLKDEAELQSWFVQRIAKRLQDRGRDVVGWDEVLEGGLAPGIIVQSWRGYEGAVAAVRQGHDVIVSPTSHCYLDYDTDRIDLATAYAFDPVPCGLTAGERGRVLGGECNMWTERAPQEVVDRQVFPRLAAIAERLWTVGEPGMADFRRRLAGHRERLRRLGVDCQGAAW